MSVLDRFHFKDPEREQWRLLVQRCWRDRRRRMSHRDIRFMRDREIENDEDDGEGYDFY